MTYEQIEKEFDEQFPAMDNYLDGGVKKDIKSFLKQSFIKYLQSEVVACNQYKSYYNQSGDQFNKGKHEAMSHMINRLEAHIKELEV